MGEEVAEAAGVSVTTRRWRELLGGDRPRPPTPMPIELKPWRRKVVISDELLEKLPKEVAQVLHDSSLSDKEKLRALLQHLYEELQSHVAVATLIGVPAITVYNWMIRLNVNVKECRARKERRLAKVKEVTPKEMVRMWAFAHSDGNAIVLGRQICVQLNTPDPWLIQLFAELFMKHAHIKVKPITDSHGRPMWHAWCYLPIEGYSWILNDELSFVTANEELWEALATLIDTEGTITIHPKKESNVVRVCLKIYSGNLRLLQYIKHRLYNEGIKVKLKYKVEAGRETNVGRLSSDIWHFTINAKPSLIRVFEEVAEKLELPWKRMLAKLGLGILRERLAWSEVEDLVREIRRFRQRTLEVSKRRILKRLAESPPRLLKPLASPLLTDG